MILLGQEQPIGIEMQEIFNPTTANMVLGAQQNYITSLQKDYETTLQQMDDLKKQYGDFYSLIDKDNENWRTAIQEPIQKIMGEYGPDVLRSVEGRAKIRAALRGVDLATLGRLKASAAAMAAYEQSKAKAIEEGKYNEDYLKFLDEQAERVSPKDWNTVEDGVFNRTAVERFESLADATPWVKDIKPSYIKTAGGYDYKGVTFDMLKDTAKAKLQGFLNLPRGQYEYKLAKDEVIAKHPNYAGTQLDEAVQDRIAEKIANAHRNELVMDKEANPYAMTRFNTDENIRQYQNTTGSHTDDVDRYNIFEESKQHTQPDNYVQFSPKDSIKLAITPDHSGWILRQGKSSVSYSVPGNTLGRFYVGADLQKLQKFKDDWLSGQKKKTFVFVPAGKMSAYQHSDGTYSYYQAGELAYTGEQKTDSSGKPIFNNQGDPVNKTEYVKGRDGHRLIVWMPVRESGQGEVQDKYIQ